MAYVAQEAGADAISLINTFTAMAIDPETRKPRIANVTAGLSGPAIKPMRFASSYDAAQAVKIPVIGVENSTPEDVIEFMLAGATAVQIRTASFLGSLRDRKNCGWRRSLVPNNHIGRLAELIGGIQLE